MKPITHGIDGISLTVKEIHKNKTFKCDCGSSFLSCDLRKTFSIKSTKTTLTFTEVIFNVRNTSTEAWSIKSGRFELIDTEGFAYGAKPLCDAVCPQRMAKVNNWSVSPGTQVNFVLAFPELEPHQKISSILYVSGGSYCTFKIAPLNPDAAELLQAREAAATAGPVENDWDLRRLRNSLDRLELQINSRLHDVLIPKEITKLENGIRQLTLQVEQSLRELSENRKALFAPRFRDAVVTYESGLELVKARENERKKLDQKVKKLYDLSPREFEEYVADLFRALGYEKVTLTPSSNDKGVDVFAEFKNSKIAIQCKKYKGLVGSPEIQTFLGAMRHAEAHKGFFVTTGAFSFEAEKIASDHPIELVDSIALGSLIQEALTKPVL